MRDLNKKFDDNFDELKRLDYGSVDSFRYLFGDNLWFSLIGDLHNSIGGSLKDNLQFSLTCSLNFSRRDRPWDNIDNFLIQTARSNEETNDA